MFKTTRSTIRATIEALKAAFTLSVSTVETLTRAIDNNSATIAANTAEQTLLRERLDTIGEHTHYLVRAKNNELSRQGHHVV